MKKRKVLVSRCPFAGTADDQLSSGSVIGSAHAVTRAEINSLEEKKKP